MSEEEGEDPALDSLSQAIAFQVLVFSRDQGAWGPSSVMDHLLGRAEEGSGVTVCCVPVDLF